MLKIYLQAKDFTHYKHSERGRTSTSNPSPKKTEMFYNLYPKSTRIKNAQGHQRKKFGLTESQLRVDQTEITSSSKDEFMNSQAKLQDSPTASSAERRFESGTIPTDTTEECQDIALYLSHIPKQPRIKFPTTKFGEKLRSFNPDWYKTYSWLEYSVNRDAAYCFPCRWFSSRLNRPDAPFTRVGSRDWKHATGQKGRLIEHRKSMAHVEAFHTWEEYKFNIQYGTTITRSLDKIGKNVIKEIVTMSKPLRRSSFYAQGKK
ncbi:Zinc finger MYM-type protein 1-like [Oopsacas minuta]|uniref:Zinc finger MYM-type protein 1-like n=1 Tax=Oopsacas minuta TaxID=111878 RepID=A0AAV7KC72_9METZ|nr:Zinc finger MYM-type protein 1-like [Oopsacas minuta]